MATGRNVREERRVRGKDGGWERERESERERTREERESVCVRES